MGLTTEESFQILQLPRGSSAEDIRASYKRLALKWHPDKHNNSTESTTKFQEISAAYKRLTTNDADDFELTPTEMYDLFTHIFFRRSAGFFCRSRPQSSHYDAESYFDDDDDDEDDEDEDDDDEFDDDILHNIASRLRSKYERKTDKPAAASRAGGKPAHNLTEEEAMRNASELIEEEERDRKKAEKRRAKKKRNKEKKKQKDKDKDKDKDKNKDKKVGKENIQDKNDTPSKTEKSKDNDSKSKISPSQPTKTVNSTSQPSNGLKEQSANTNKKQQSSEKLKTRRDEEEASGEESPDWDTSSAFYARAAAKKPVNNPSSNPPASSQAKSTINAETPLNPQNSKSNPEKQPSSEEIDPVVLRSRQFAVSGNEMANSGNYQAAVDLFTQAIKLDDRDFRFFGNRSYCFDRLGQFEKALQDADMAISLAPDWPKGYFRRGRALAGLKLFLDAESSFAQVLKLDKHCEDALFELARVRIQQLEEMGFPTSQSEAAIQSFGTVQAALEALLAGKVKCPTTEEVYVSDGEEEQPRPTTMFNNSNSDGACRSVWVGNVNSEEVSERQLLQLFTRCGRVDNVRILPKRFCAFINYESAESAARAIQKLQGYELGGQNLVMRFPNNSGASVAAPVPAAAAAVVTPAGALPKKRNSLIENPADKLSGPVHGGECYFWRTTGCAFGDKCHYTHIAENKGVDLRRVEAKYGGRLRVN